MSYEIEVEDFGKIKKAKVKVSPLTLFVGDNNSGKSYLLTLIWGLRSNSLLRTVTRKMEGVDRKYYQNIYDKIKRFTLDMEDDADKLEFTVGEFEEFINQLFIKNKNTFVQKLFNCETMHIGKLRVQLEKQNKIVLRKGTDSEMNQFYSIGYKRYVLKFRILKKERIVEEVLERFIRKILLDRTTISRRNIYFPASRTGFLLARDSINRKGRDKTFGMDMEEEDTEVEPFTMPILDFIDNLDSNKRIKQEESYKKIRNFIETEVVHGKIERESSSNNRVEYIPELQNTALPMRTSSAVVTELVPLILILESKMKISQLCYEEPEMCLHPELQLQMARILIQLVNHNVTVIATTHSDIILQHVNNMCCLMKQNRPKEFMEQYGLKEEDCIGIENVAVYQFTNEGESSVVTQIEPEEEGFQVPTFSNALLNILEQTTQIQDYQSEQED